MICLLLILSLCAQAWANTEAYLFQVPNYYSIPQHDRQSYNHKVVKVNESTLLLSDHPVLAIDHYSTANSVISIPYDFHTKQPQTLFVRLNNYNDSSFDCNDLIHVKLCWPATTPIDFRIQHQYLKETQFGTTPQGPNSLDIYIAIELRPDFYALSDIPDTSFEVLLLVSKLPSRVPIPIELYDYILYLLDLLVLSATALPAVMRLLYRVVGVKV